MRAATPLSSRLAFAIATLLNPVALLSAATLLTASAVHAADIPSNARMTDGAIDVDERNYATQQAAIKTLNDTGKHRVRSYSLAKAQCWLDVSFHEYTRNDRSSFPEDALAESRKITDFLASGSPVTGAANPAQQTPLVNGAARLREDLWQRTTALRGDGGFACVEQLIACAEVELVHAGNEFNQQQWNHAKPYVQLAEDQIAAAESAVVACRPRAPLVRAVEPAPTPAPAKPATTPAAVSTETISLSAGALFRFNRRGEGDLLPAGRAQLDDLAERITSVYTRVDQIRLVGHTDRLGSDAYNDQLSIDRANTVRGYLQSRGVTATMNSDGRGKREPIKSCDGNTPTTALTACLQPNRRVEISITGVKR